MFVILFCECCQISCPLYRDAFCSVLNCKQRQGRIKVHGCLVGSSVTLWLRVLRFELHSHPWAWVLYVISISFASLLTPHPGWPSRVEPFCLMLSDRGPPTTILNRVNGWNQMERKKMVAAAWEETAHLWACCISRDNSLPEFWGCVFYHEEEVP